MADQELKTTLVVAAEDQTKSTFQEIKSGAKEMADSVQRSGEEASKKIKGLGDEAENTAQKMTRAEGSIAQALQRATEKTKIAAQAGESLSRAFEQKIELRGLDASKLNPFVQQLREAENALAAVKAQQAQAAGQNAFLDSLRSQTEVIGKTKTELLELKAAQLGMSTAAAPYIAKLREAEAGLGKVGMSAAQTANAMRMVPAQFTDIVVSLQSGQAPLTVLLQQGGQLKDMFGSAGAAARGMASYVMGLVNPYTAAAAAVALLGFAYYQGSKEVDAYRKSLVLSGNQAGVTVDQLNAMARSMKDAVGTQGAAAAGLAEMAQKSKVGSDNLKEFTTSAIQWEKATGQAVSETAKQFADLANDPLKATLALNEQMNFLTVATYEQIKALDEQGKKEEAAAVAQKAYSDAMKSRAAELKQNLGYIELAVEMVTGGAKKMWDAILGVGRQSSPTDKAAKHIADLEAQIADRNRRAQQDGDPAWAIGTEKLQRQLTAAKDFLSLTGSVDTYFADQQKAQKEAVDSAAALDQLSGQFATKEMNRKRELTAAENIYLESVKGTMKAYADSPKLTEKLVEQAAKYEKAVAGIEKKFAEKGGSRSGAGRGENEIANIRALIAQEDEMIQRYQTRGAAAEKMTDAEKLLSRLESQRAETSNKTIRAEKERAIVEAQKLVAKQAYRKELEAAAKAEEDQNEANRKSIEAMLKSAAATEDEAERIEASLHVYGKARTEIERLTLAKLEQKKADMDGLASPEAMAAIQARIDAQKKLVESLEKLDYKKLDDKLTKSLETSKEELAIQQDGLSLLGLDETLRKKVIAQRRIELELSKQIAEINRAKFSDDEEESERQKEELRQKARLKSEADTQTAVLKIQEEYINQQVQQYDDIFRRGFADMLNNGKDGWDSFTKSLTTTFKTTVADQIYKMFLRPFVVKVVAQMVGMTGASQELPGTGVAGGSNLLGGSLTNWSNWGSSASGWASDASFKLVSNGWTEMGSSMLGLSRTITSVDSYLKTIPGMSGGIGSAAGYLGSIYALTQGQYGAGLGSAIGTAILPGIGTMIGGALGGLVDSLFGGDSIPRYAATAEYRGGVTSKGWTPDGQWNDALYPTVNGLAGAIGSALDATAKTFGQTAGYELFASFSKDAESNMVFGALNIKGPDGKSLVDWSQYDKDWGGRFFSDGDAGSAEFMAAITADVKTAFAAMDIPTWSKQLINAAEDINGINAALQQIGATKALFDSWGQSMSMFNDITGELQTQLLNGFGGSMDALSSGVGAFYEGLYTEQERMTILAGNLRDSLAGISIGIDPALGETAKAQFKSAVEAAMAAGQGELSAKLLAMSQAFVTAADYAQKATDSLRSSLIGLEGKFAGGGFSRQYQAEDLASQVQGMLSGVGIQKDAGALAKTLLSATSADVESYFREIWNVLPTDEARQKLIGVAGSMLDLAAAADAAAKAVASEREGLEQRWLQAIGDTAEMRRRELEALDPSNRALLEMIYGLEDAKQSMTDLTAASQAAAQKAAAAWQGWGTAAGLGAQYLGDTSGLEARRAILNAQINASTDPAERLSKLQELISVEQAIGQAQQASRKTELEAINARQSALQKEISAAQQLLSAAQGLGSYVQSLRLGEASGLSDVDRLGALGREYTSLIGKARGGDADALKQLQGVSGDYLSLAQTLAVSGSDYSVLSGRMAAEMEALAKGQELVAQSQVTGYEAQIAQLAQQTEILSANYELTDGTKSLIAKLTIEQAEVWDRENTQALTLQELQQRATDSLALMPDSIARALRPALDSSASYLASSIGSTVVNALNSLAGMLGMDGSHANGLPYVPFDGYRAELHRGERVLTAEENRMFSAPRSFVMQGGQGVSGLVAELMTEVRALRTQVAALQRPMEQTAAATTQHAEQFDNATAGGNGMAVSIMEQAAPLQVKEVA